MSAAVAFRYDRNSLKCAPIPHPYAAPVETLAALPDFDWVLEGTRTAREQSSTQTPRIAAQQRRRDMLIRLVFALTANRTGIPVEAILSETRGTPMVNARKQLVAALAALGVPNALQARLLRRDHASISFMHLSLKTKAKDLEHQLAGERTATHARLLAAYLEHGVKGVPGAGDLTAALVRALTARGLSHAHAADVAQAAKSLIFTDVLLNGAAVARGIYLLASQLSIRGAALVILTAWKDQYELEQSLAARAARFGYRWA